MVGTSTGTVNSTRVILDYVRPKATLWDSKLKIRAKEKKFEECFDKMLEKALAQDEEYKHSALLETLRFVGKV